MEKKPIDNIYLLEFLFFSELFNRAFQVQLALF
jgi:hypothetical protein